ncbi:MAG TPA: T9SS type A sorting domain-containing protein [Chryseosolibacter sp.]|nr:T9SS type A sorting domain-containing protein [Chryseosolibacter sp.]
MRSTFNCLLTFAILLTMHDAAAQLYQTCDRWGNITTGGYTVYNNIWGTRRGTQCLTVFNYNNWYVDANFEATRRGGVKSYPNVERKVNLFVDNMGSVSSTFSASHPGTGSYVNAYDIWYNNYAYEVMLWMSYTGAVGPISYSYACNGACPEATNVSVGGHTWNVYRGSNGSNEVFSFVRTSNTNSGTVDITAISQWIRARGWFGNANLHSIQFGFEITGTLGTQRFSVTNFSVSAPTNARMITSETSAPASPEEEVVFTSYPNPVQTTATLTVGNEWIGSKVNVMDTRGSVMQTSQVKQTRHVLDLTSFPSGLYIIQVSNNRKRQTLKIVKQ